MFLKAQATFLVVVGVLVYQVYSAIDQPCNFGGDCPIGECCLFRSDVQTSEEQHNLYHGTCQKLGDVESPCRHMNPPLAPNGLSQGLSMDYCPCQLGQVCIPTSRHQFTAQQGPATGTCRGIPGHHMFGPGGRPTDPPEGVRRRR